MGYIKQLHIDCYEGTCIVNQEETCYMQPNNPSHINVNELEGDYDAYFDEDREEATTFTPQEEPSN